MGPSSFERGNARQVLDLRSKFLVLQWGRARSSAETWAALVLASLATYFNGAALVRARKRKKIDLLKQWVSDFNGAALVRARKRRVSDGGRRGGATSMGPRSFERGNGSCSVRRARRSANFNGAALVRARKRPDHLPEFTVESHFNGAALVRARKRGPTTPKRSKNDVTSMGPRSFERGNVRHGSRRLNAGLGHFNGAALVRARKQYCGRREFPKVEVLQWGRARSSAETKLNTPLAETRRDRTSMGPRSFERGNSTTGTSLIDSIITSMGPRSFERGNASCSCRRRSLTAYFNGAALVRARKRRTCRRSSGMGRSNFNGAALVRARKLACGCGLILRLLHFNGAALVRARKRC